MRIRFKWLLTLVGIVVFMISGGAWYIWSGLKPLPTAERNITVTIKPGAGIDTIVSQLEAEGVIRNALVSKLYLKWCKEGSRFQAGTYTFRAGITLDDMIIKLNKGDVVPKDMVRFTIPEGYTIEQIANRLSRSGIVDKAEFMQLVAEPTWLSRMSSLVQAIPHNKKLRHKLEGYLFAETYEFPKDKPAKDIIARMVQETEKKLMRISPTWEADMRKQKLTLHELMTIASLIEQEITVDEERPLVAGVIYNRMRDGMRLQLCATVLYALGKSKERLLYQDLKVDSPYNTYQILGLPPGPIASPSMASIEAALYPQQSDYFYYVTKGDSTKSHLFAKTFAEHRRNIKNSNQAAKRWQRSESGAS